MNLLDLLIIYSAMAAPFAVYRFLQRSSDGLRTAWISSAIAFLVWPVYAFILVTRQIGSKSITLNKTFFDRSMNGRDEEISCVARRLRTSLSRANISLGHFEIRDRVDRYVELTIAAETDGSNSSYAELFSAAGRKDPGPAEHCLIRRNAARLVRHQKDARDDFLELMALAACTKSNRFVIDESIRLAELLNDGAAAKRLDTISRAALPDAGNAEGTWNTDEQQLPANQLTPAG